MKNSIITVILLAAILFFGCVPKNNSAFNPDDVSILVFVTGLIAGSPAYELMAEGANAALQKYPDLRIKIYEAGINQAEWEMQLTEMISTGEYNIVIGSNPSLPEICKNAMRHFPDIKFIILDAFYEGNPQIKTYFYNQYEQSLLLGYLAGLITVSDMPNANRHKRIGFIAAQEYPLLTNQMVPGFLKGARLVDNEIELDMRIVGNWIDASKASELTSAMIDSGVDVFTAIAGGAAQGMIRTAADRGAYIVWYNNNAYNLARGVIVGCGIMEQKKLMLEIIEEILSGEMQYGYNRTIGISDGYLGFITDDPAYQNLPLDIRTRFEQFLNEF
ncbi:MAG: BMP family ABC transporter substrate-binding protein [Treponema sp.]|nr:BMP family ABC transporter substrate-binding protein [Treponema sp.]